jgi:hypothetical protein
VEIAVPSLSSYIELRALVLYRAWKLTERSCAIDLANDVTELVRKGGVAQGDVRHALRAAQSQLRARLETLKPRQSEHIAAFFVMVEETVWSSLVGPTALIRQAV